MFSHIFISVNEFERALAFYKPVMDALGFELRFSDAARPWAGWHSSGKTRPFFVICRPFDGQPHDPGNGQLVAFAARDRATVRRVYDTALKLGARDEGSPGLRPQYHANYYGAYFRDLDGNKFCVASHEPESEE